MENKKISGIYSIKNIINNKIYIGSSFDIYDRFKYHLWQLNNNRHHSFLLQKSWNKYGEHSFILEIIEEIEDLNALLIKEQYYLDKYKTYEPKNGFNIADRAGNPKNLFSEETRKKISEKNKGKLVSEQTRLKMSIARTGIKLSEQHKEKISKSKKGIAFSEEHKKNLSEAQKGLKRVFTEEHKKKLSASLKNRKHSDELKKKIGLSSRGRCAKLTPENVIEIRKLYNIDNISVAEIRKKFNISRNNIYSIINRETWGYIDDRNEEASNSGTDTGTI